MVGALDAREIVIPNARVLALDARQDVGRHAKGVRERAVTNALGARQDVSPNARQDAKGAKGALVVRRVAVVGAVVLGDAGDVTVAPEVVEGARVPAPGDVATSAKEVALGHAKGNVTGLVPARAPTPALRPAMPIVHPLATGRLPSPSTKAW